MKTKLKPNTKLIAFNKPYFSSDSIEFIKNAVQKRSISGNGFYTQKCNAFFEAKYGFKNCFLTPSCTDALEMVALLLDIKPGDEIIMPSFTFVSTANAFVIRGAKIRFVDSNLNEPNIDSNQIESLITKKTKAIVIVHYAGYACDMKYLKKLQLRYKLPLVEDCAHSIDSFLFNKPLGSFGDFSTFSFHDTKNLTCGEGGLLVVNNKKYVKRAEIIREKGTNRTAFFRGEIKKYEWIDIGSSFLASDISAAYLFGQLVNLKKIQNKRVALFKLYITLFKNSPHYKKYYEVPIENKNVKTNGHIFYLIIKSKNARDDLLETLEKQNIQALSHYVPLHSSPFYRKITGALTLPNCDNFSEKIIRLPLHYYLSNKDAVTVSKVIFNFFDNIKA
jgi:dTDP-4-amino-4,6-dideoxygalactose transaminase